jgi:hypothetical protein
VPVARVSPAALDAVVAPGVACVVGGTCATHAQHHNSSAHVARKNERHAPLASCRELSEDKASPDFAR